MPTSSQTLLTDPAILTERFSRIRNKTEEICEPLLDEDTALQPVVDVSPPKWHLAHTSWFFETFILRKYLKGYREFHPDFNFLFNSYYESVGERVLRDQRGFLSRPGRAEIMRYRRHVTENMQKLLSETDIEENSELAVFLETGLQHEQQHQELLVTDIKYILGNNPLFPTYHKTAENRIPSGGVPPLSWLSIEEGLYDIGYAGEGFSWDNEKPVHSFYLKPFRAANRLTTNGEYMEFMQEGGYGDFRHWLSDGWALCQTEKWEAPMYWHKKDGSWHYYTLGGLKPVNPDEPVTHISFYEADAFASWAGKRLLTEQEWETAAGYIRSQKGSFADSGQYQPQPLDRNVLESTASTQWLGDTWEWTYSGYFPYPGYRQAEGALGEYNGKFMINQMVLRGGSCATPEDHARLTYRNFFPADKRWQFSGIRLGE
jgi:ergothioneine biosynthesis protein EgtB